MVLVQIVVKAILKNDCRYYLVKYMNLGYIYQIDFFLLSNRKAFLNTIAMLHLGNAVVSPEASHVQHGIAILIEVNERNNNTFIKFSSFIFYL